MIGVTVLGSTGSVGVNTLEVLALHPQRFRVIGLAARSNVERLLEQCLRFAPQWAVMESSEAALALERRLRAQGVSTRVAQGAEAIAHLAAQPESAYVMAAITGAAGLRSTLAAARAGKRLLLANKESAVMAGALLMEAVASAGSHLIPIDSEHNAIFQCLPAGVRAGVRPEGVRRLLLTCSGGPFLTWPTEAIAQATPAQACAHPRWNMGRKISVDSATLMNKGLELIEASVLFAMPPEAIDIVVHPQSIVHSLVEYEDGSVLAQLGAPDMRVPIAMALAWPQRMSAGARLLDLVRSERLEFLAPDPVRFPCVRHAQAALRAGPASCVSLNAANEVAVEAFLDKRLNFGDIPAVIEQVLTRTPGGSMPGLDAIMETDTQARSLALEVIERRSAAQHVHA